ncbi:arylamine N-acetyltransferase family protein [Streptomyces bambusae]|uniref:Arylamine N-acetyltransferase n=1 Tax=Streptomyces bambusae TaxID=1550616 RepID=A0ABS6ZAJ7_9ACTN|nr:arylamine N-acetyltransferase [Streptomyces bambusae]MBW5484766.1 arylamine N-acetyltransferase [Streptomyces bambusae]
MTGGRATGWQGELLDLEAYLERIGFDGERTPTLGTLRELVRAHVTALRFENIDAVLGVPIPLDVPAVQDKLVRGGRGGYCYEHAALFAAALERLGFGFTALAGRVTLGSQRITPATHALLLAEVPGDDRRWLCDVGFGAGPLEPLELADGARSEAGGWRHRLERRPGEFGVDQWWLHQDGPDGWVDRHSFTLTPQYPIDFVGGSHYVGTHPRSPFTRRLLAQRFDAGRHQMLDAAVWTTTLPDGTRTERTVAPGELGKVLREEFGIVVDEETVARLADTLQPAA